MKIAFYTKYDRMGASSRYRTYQFLEKYWEAGIETRTFHLFPSLYLEELYGGLPFSASRRELFAKRHHDLERIREFDLVVIEKELFPFIPAFMEKKYFEGAKKLLLDYDDAIFVKYQKHPNLLVRLLMRHKLDQLMALSDGVIGGNRFLCEYADRFAPRTWLVPTSVDVDKYIPHDQDHEGLISIGWIGTPITAKYLEIVRRPMERLAQVVPLRFIVIGAPAPDWHGVQAQSHQWSEEDEAKLIRWMDIGIMPLEDTLWEKGKCGLKLLQYMAGNVIPVGSDVGANRDILEQGVDGFLCKTEEDWFETLKDLAENQQKRVQVAEAASRKVRQEYSIEVAAAKLIEIFREVTGISQ
ncbi:MAG: glycosyltransferase family 4 protein [Candidatus Omnitrophica bacterium]|nr:glycosyltransferase family 4 protein [Candidatus Omnitrophota bacterium]MCA9417176.1 glycosyltransferase family 4 protein [Candidatus Omnitrophota bacterium]MCA9429839.1 glycosyltransferase family 4 protein [Candidatus Omnitrophota bacterium]MCB9768112.1 glycosyltransferase family 4 protein [Candidatus Omnitrophota bacterium]